MYPRSGDWRTARRCVTESNTRGPRRPLPGSVHSPPCRRHQLTTARRPRRSGRPRVAVPATPLRRHRRPGRCRPAWRPRPTPTAPRRTPRQPGRGRGLVDEGERVRHGGRPVLLVQEVMGRVQQEIGSAGQRFHQERGAGCVARRVRMRNRFREQASCGLGRQHCRRDADHRPHLRMHLEPHGSRLLVRRPRDGQPAEQAVPHCPDGLRSGHRAQVRHRRAGAR